jgi:Bacterial pre-peptidase C-terminal domain
MNLHQISTRNNTIAGSLTSGTAKKFSGSLAKGETDTFNFTLGKNSSFNMKLGKLSANADVQVLDSSGKVVARSNQPDNRAEKISKSLDSGSYTVRIRSSKGKTQYSLRMLANDLVSEPAGNPRTTFPVLPTDPGNTLETSYDIGIVGTSASVTDKLSSLDPLDFYRFTLSQPGFYIINTRILDGATAPDSIFTGYLSNDPNNTANKYDIIRLTLSNGTISIDATGALQPGQYFFKASRDTSLQDIPYTLTITKQP